MLEVIHNDARSEAFVTVDWAYAQEDPSSQNEVRVLPTDRSEENYDTDGGYLITMRLELEDYPSIYTDVTMRVYVHPCVILSVD